MNRATTARPMPEPPPVTSATLPSSQPIACLSFHPATLGQVPVRALIGAGAPAIRLPSVAERRQALMEPLIEPVTGVDRLVAALERLVKLLARRCRGAHHAFRRRHVARSSQLSASMNSAQR